jgi:hypothetical protein
MRASRDEETLRSFIWDEIRAGRLRQGWGYDDCQNLKRIAGRWSEVSWAEPETPEVGERQEEAWRHWRMLGNDSPPSMRSDAMQIGDIVLVPNMPTDGRFTLCRITGPYEWNYSSDPRGGH